MSVTSVQSSRQRHGRRFEPVAEQELHDVVPKLAESVWRGATPILVAEPPGPFGVPDFVAIREIEPGALRRRIELQVPPLLNQIDAGVVAVASDVRPLRIPTLAKRTGWTVETVVRRLPTLVRTGALIQCGRDTYVRPTDLVAIGDTLAVEVKLRDWRKALRQAHTYSLWCDNYLIVMGDLSDTGLLHLRAQALADRGGLVVNGKWVTRPRRSRPLPTRRLWGSEHLVAALQNHQPSSAP